MYFINFKVILLIFLSTQLLCSKGFDAKFEKSTKSSDLKHKLAKAEYLRAEESEPEKIAVTDEDVATESIDILGITVPPDFNSTTVQHDYHEYYNSTFYTLPDEGKKFWIDLDGPLRHTTIHEMLSNSHRQATTVELSFEFPFYGQILRNVTIATGGFLYMGDYLHNWIAATQYVAPLMANFDTSQSLLSLIRYADNGTAFTTEWKNVYIQDQMRNGSFTFQATLFDNGDIHFAYKNIPYPIANIPGDRHPVKIGISDAYILERSLFFVRRKTIYEYHRVDMLARTIANNTALIFSALPTCPSFKDCTSCLAAESDLECNWCEEVKRCSNGVDRARQSWVTSGCVLKKVTTCSAQSVPVTDISSNVPNKETEEMPPNKGSITTQGKYTSKYVSTSPYNMDSTYSVPGPSDNDVKDPAHYVQGEINTSNGVSTGAIVTIVVFLAALIGAGLWVGYAYKFPQTSSGQFLIKYRPSQWSLRPKDDNSVSSNSRHL